MRIPPLIGLTGGIASGKSSVARLFAAQGAALVDADAIYHRLIAPCAEGASPLARRIAETFGDVLRADGSLDRPALGRQVFADPSRRRRLESVTHPAVRAEAARQVAHHRRANAPCVIYDVPLLFERDMAGEFAAVVVVWVSTATQLRRLQARDQVDEHTAQTRLAAQMSLEDKRARATYVIDNDGPETELLAQIVALMPLLTQLAPD